MLSKYKNVLHTFFPTLKKKASEYNTILYLLTNPVPHVTRRSFSIASSLQGFYLKKLSRLWRHWHGLGVKGHIIVQVRRILIREEEKSTQQLICIAIDMLKACL